jgi:hypothetical protein
MFFSHLCLMNDGEIGKYSTLHVKLSKKLYIIGRWASEADTHNLLGMITQVETCIWLILIIAVLPLCSIRSGGW